MSIVDNLKSNKALFREYGVRHAWLFGSASRGEDSVGDVDLLVEFKEAPGLMEYMGLKFRLEELLQSRVDIVSKSACKERFYKHIEPDLVHVA